ncbi:non-ribosomal peptide synthetase [Nonomuraea sediminis]|uniref:non-ribosomal peptide synthetase n=1 Tax=Nonomuraea sediminis TaxID=2835864 RepID=UPI001BDC9DFA|nr:non-ribosomal peptide synthetase [Nonomuraea sediminis]
MTRFVLPAGFGQRRLWFLHQLDPASTAAYVDHGALRLRGELDADAAQRALDRLVARHETLRTCLDAHDGEPVQIVAETLQVPLERVELDGRDLAEAVRAITRRAFDLAVPPLFRVALIRVGPREHVLVAAFHHSVYDQWSAGVFLREFLACYAAETRGEEPDLPDLPVQYGDYAAWQLEAAAGERAEQVAYWKRQLDGMAPLDLPTDRPRPAMQTFGGASRTVRLDGGLVARLEEIARGENATPFMALLAGFTAVLSFHSGQDDVAVGSPIAGRDLPELQHLIGFFVNNLVLRNDLSGSPAFRELLGRVRRTCLDAYAHQDVPFDRLVEELRPARDLSRSPLFQVMFVFGNVPLTATQDAGLSVEMLRVDPGTAKFDLFLMLLPVGDGIEVTLEYNTDLFDAATIDALLRHYTALLESAADDPDRPLAPAAMITDEDRALLDRQGVGPQATADSRGVAALVAEQAARTPDAVAVGTLTYAELDARANRLARHLRGLGVGRNDVVAVHLDRGTGLVVALLGVLRAGAAYLPLDAELPEERIAYMLADSAAAALVTDRSSGFSGKIVDPTVSESGPAGPIPSEAGPEDLAYLIYTSGSTGRPKGVLVPNRALTTFLTSMAVRPGIAADDVMAAVTTVSFDIAALEIFLPLLAGARVEMIDRTAAADGTLLAARLRERHVTVMQATPTTWRLLLDAGWRADGPFTALVGGEAVPADLVRELSAAGARVWNMYGPTETTVWSSCCPLTGTEDLVPLGEPIPGTELRVLDDRRRLVPPGVPGEIHIGGDGLAHGYHGRESLTAERFVPDPRDPRRRLYRTGDAARLRADGRLEFLGRLDDQIKLHGYRIEPGAIEAVLREHPSVRDAAVTVAEHGPGDRRLAAYAEPADGDIPQREIWEKLRARLPGYMVPSSLSVLERLPRTPNNKVDRRSLPAPGRTAATGASQYEPPATEPERRVARVWQEVLGVDRVGRDDDFFTIGGNSLLATRVVAALDAPIPVRAMFERPTVASLAGLLEETGETREQVKPRPRVPEPDGSYLLPASAGQRRLWFLQELEPGSGAAYVMHGAVGLTGPLDPDRLQRALDAVVARHETLRTAFALRDGEPHQQVRPDLRIPIRRLDLDPDDLEHLLKEDARTPFTLTEAPLARVTLIRLAPEEHVLAMALHHGVCDGWSTGVLVRELVHCYTTGTPDGLPELKIQYADLAQPRPEPEALAYWRDELADAPVLDLASDRPRPAVQSFAGATLETRLPARTLERLRRLADSAQVTQFMILLAATSVVLGRYARQDDVVVGSPVSGRERPETADLIGFCANTLVLRMRLDGDPTVTELLGRARDVCLGAYAHAEVPFERLVEELRPVRDLSRTPLFQVALSAGENPLPGGRLGQATVEPLDVDAGTAKFDLALLATPRGDGLRVAAEYNTDLFDAETIGRLLDQLVLVLDAFEPGRRLSDLPPLTAAERALLERWGRGPELPLPEMSPAELFERQARARPDAIAVECGEDRLTYRELDTRANRLAHLLRELGAGPGTLVGLGLDRSANLPVAVLGVLKSGGAYLPIDPEYPPARVEFMLADSQAPVLVTTQTLLDRMPKAGRRVVCLDRDAAEIARRPGRAPTRAAGPGDLAYVIYTSGSTGRPKGAMVSNQGVANLHLTRDLVGMREDDRMLQFAAFSFDASVWEMVMALLGGATLVIPAPDEPRVGTGLAEVISRRQVTITLLPASLLAHLNPEDVPTLRTLVTGGEDCPAAVAERWSARTRLINAYGPTEVTVYATLSDPVSRPGHPPIGWPVTNARLHVVAPGGNVPAPIGVPGELLVGGPGVGLGYLNRPDQTAERFVAGPEGERVYRTGDLVRYRHDGNLEFVGRIDHQVKLRGYRIELGEVEQVLREHPAVRDAVAAVRDERLVAYVVPDGTLDTDALRGLARARMPEYMVPAVIVPLDELPLTPSRKVDRDALPDPRTLDHPSGGEAPRDDVERVLCEILAAALGVESVGRDDDFFARGGHSLMAVRVLEEARDRLGLDIPIRRFFEHPTAADLAQADGQGEPDVRADIRLDPEILPGDQARMDGTVLVTGATGFLGGFLLARLLAEGDDEIVCLVRAPDPETGLARLAEHLAAQGTWQESWRTRLRAVPGDLAQPLLGLAERDFAALAGELATIYHVGASVNLLHSYADLRGPNVDGTREVLRLAATGPLTTVHHVSTTSVFPLGGAEGPVRTESELPDDPPPPEIAYNQAKWAAEHVVRLARERGLPVAVYRPGRITGDTAAGVWRTDDMVCRLIRAFVLAGAAPDVDLATDMQPVDGLADAIVRLSRSPEAAGRTFHFRAPKPVAVTEFVDVLNAIGHQVDKVPVAEWDARADGAVSGTEREMFRRRIAHHTEGKREPVLDIANTERLLGHDALLPQVDEVIMRRYAERMIATGFLPAPAGRT